MWLKASDIDRKLTWPRVSKELGSDRSRDANAIEAARRVASAYPSRPLAEKPAAEQAAERVGRIRRQQDCQQDRDRGMGR